MNFGLILLLPLLAVPGAPGDGFDQANQPSRARVRDRLAALAGTWALRSVEWMGEIHGQDPHEHPELDEVRAYRGAANAEQTELPAEEPQKRGLVIDFLGNRFTQHTWRPTRGCIIGGESISTGTVRLRERVTVGEIELRSAERTWRSLYSVDGNTLRMCTFWDPDSNSAPTEFDAADNQDVLILIFERERQ